MTYFGEIGCAHCDTFFSKDLPAAERRAGIVVSSEAVDILSSAGYARCERELSERGQSFRVFPVLIIGNNAYQGNTAIEENLDAELAFFAANGVYRPWVNPPAMPDPARSSLEKPMLRLALLPVLVAGLIDGVNPCAFATMLFFMSWITLRGGGKRKMALTGGAFILGVFTAYIGIGIGLSAAMEALADFSAVRAALRAFFSVAAATFAVLSGYDAISAFRGRQASMLLQLPAPVKALIHRTIRKRADGANRLSPIQLALFFITGVTVSFLELACTGQVYLPTIAYMVQTAVGTDRVQGFSWLILYNIAFILPLTAIFALCVAGVSLDRLRSFFMKHIGVAKVVIAVLFAGLAALIWLS